MMAIVSKGGGRFALVVWIFSGVVCCSQFSGWEDYISSWQEQPWASRMYPFGQTYFDNTLTNSDGADAQISFILPFFGNIYSAAYISMEGHIELSSTNPATSTPKAPNTRWPNENYPQTGDVPFIGLYYAQFEMTNLPDDRGRLYWRRVDPGEVTDPARVDIATSMVSRLSEEVRAYVVGSEHFEGSYALIATWNESTFYACLSDSCPTNTVQVAIVTDEQSTYVIYNYYTLTWIGSVRQGYDPETGVNCQGSCVPAQAGFNAGRAQAFYSLPFSGTDDVLRLAETSGTGIMGRFIYKVDSFDIVRGGCSNISDIDPVDWPLHLSPSHGTMLGGQAVYVSGPCFLPNLPVRCMFDEWEVDGWRLPGDNTRAVCITPFIGYTGRVAVKVSTNSGITWPYVGQFNFDMPDEGPEHVTLDNRDLWENKTAGSLSFHWDTSALDDSSDWMTNSTPQFNVDIRLCAYFETLLPNGSSGEIKELHMLAENIPNMGVYTFNVGEHQCSERTECQWAIPLPTGLIEIRRANTGSWPSKIWSRPFPLGWYGNGAWIGWHGDEWAEQFCNWWFDYEFANMTWLDDVEPCPVTEGQALADSGRFAWNPCNTTSPGICYTNQQMACYDQVTPNTNQWPAVSHCCYNNEGYLVYAADDNYGVGSISFKATLGSDRKATYGKVPLLSHYTWDNIFRILCCNWTSDPKYCQDLYLRVRPTKDIQKYVTPRSVTSFGDPHFRTFDGVDYTFNGRGEYWLLRVYDMDVDLDNIVVQVRLEKPTSDIWGDVRATVITSVVMQEGYAEDMTVPIVEIQMAEQESMVRQKLLLSGEIYDLRPLHNRRLEVSYRENNRLIIIVNNEPTPNPDNKQSNISVVFQSGVMVQVAYVEGALHVISILPYKYKGKTAGLFGLWSDKKDDDLTTPGGEPIDYTKGNEFIHYNFGEKWVLSDVESRFTYRGSLTSSHYHHPEFIPYFTEPVLPPNSTLTETDVDEACGTDFVCRFDYKTTLSRELAVTSSLVEIWTSEIVEMSKPVAACPYIDVPYSRRQVSGYTSGGTITFTGCADEYTLQGHVKYTCVVENGSAYWQPAPDVLCKANSEIAAEKQQKAIMIAAPICCVVVAAGIATGGYFLYKYKKKPPAGESASQSNEFSYRSGSGHVGPMAVSGQNVDPDLLSQRRVTLIGSADLGLSQIYSDRSLPRHTGQDVGISHSPEPEYARIVHNRRGTNEESRGGGIQPSAMQQSFPSNSDVQAEDAENSRNEVILQANRYPSGSELDLSQTLMDRSRLNASELQLHPPALENQPVAQQEGIRNAAIRQSVTDLIQLDDSSLFREDAVLNHPRPCPSSERLSRSHDALNDIQDPVTLGTGYMNLAASVGSLNRSDVDMTMAASLRPSQTSAHYASGHDNVALATDEIPVVKPAPRFAAYAAAFGSDTVV